MSGQFTISVIVEGHGDAAAVPVLIRRVAGEVFGVYSVRVTPPHRVPRTGMRGEPARKAIRFQGMRVAKAGGLIVVADSDDDCAVQFAQHIRTCAGSLKIEVALAVREFEAWFLAAAESLRSYRAVREDAKFDRDPETPRDAKGELQRLMTEPYRETLHQPAFASIIDIEQARSSRSFEHLVRCVGRILRTR